MSGCNDCRFAFQYDSDGKVLKDDKNIPVRLSPDMITDEKGNVIEIIDRDQCAIQGHKEITYEYYEVKGSNHTNIDRRMKSCSGYKRFTGALTISESTAYKKNPGVKC